ncbi:MAG: hypothetical protein JRF33_22415 [Deltaproteobacteria bacterium]|nr:hypothetical protein [Deltaproteobacteria bacterium]
MIKQILTLLTLSSLIFLLAPSAMAAPEPMSRQEILDLASSAVGYSYWWGKGCWRSDGADQGSCSGSCPSCTHTGSYGADCSGFAAKCWQVPGPSPLTTNAHPYNTGAFRYSSYHWEQITRADALAGDCMVYRNDGNTGGHIVVYDGGDPWGNLWTYEARGCSYGIVHNLRTLSSAYVAIQRDNLSSVPSTGKLQGTVFVDRGLGTADMTERIPGATISTDGQSVIAQADNAYWSFQLEPGDYTIQVSAAGFIQSSKSCVVTSGGESWCSIGMAPACEPDCSGKTCGDDGCGGSCGTCNAGHACQANQCVCQPDCAGLECGPDPVCGQSCGDCDAGWACDQGSCGCQPQCDNRQCGADPNCGATCGSCPENTACSADGLCLPVGCNPTCDNRQCGPDPLCGQSCGTCGAGEVCDPLGRCVPDVCTADCSNRSCGPDPLCGTSCGHCEPADFCNADGACQDIDDSHGKIYGWVVELRDEEAHRIGGARVWIADQPALQADESGYFEMLLDPGDYIVSGMATGYKPGEVECESLPGLGTECNLTLEPNVEPRNNGDDEETVIKGGCASAGQGSSLLALFGLLSLVGLRRRKN